jgi:hypothetical protein
VENRWPFDCSNVEAGRAVGNAGNADNAVIRLRQGFVGQLVERVVGQVCGNGWRVAGRYR